LIVRTLTRSFAIGVAAGLRSQVPSAVITDAARTGRLARGSGPIWDGLRAPVASKLGIASMLGEMVGDKLPVTPPRIAQPALSFRILSGGLAGAFVASGLGAKSGGLAFAALAGAAGAYAGTYGGYHARKGIADTGVPDLPIALVEDVTALAIGRLAVAREL
jgi:uncharacterized membrane protein